ncbi:YceG-like family protein [compost metagenome]
MVGREAIHAALNPSDGSSLYFVARGDGSHVFSDDLDDHNSAVREFQLKRRADYRSSPAPQSQAQPGAGEAEQPETPADEPTAQPAPDEPPVQDAPAGGAQAAERPTPDEQH